MAYRATNSVFRHMTEIKLVGNLTASPSASGQVVTAMAAQLIELKAIWVVVR